MNKNDLVSIVMPSYNTAKFIEETINSVLNQTYKNWELIIVDDYSIDNTDDIVSKFTDDRIRYIKNEKNYGAAVSRNIALRKARGRWIAFLDSDDLWHKEKLERQIKFMKENNYSFSYTNYHQIDEESNCLNISVTGPKEISKYGMFRYCWVGCLTVMYDFNKVGIIQIKNIRKNNDYAMWLKVAKKENCYLLDEDLASYRIRSGSISRHSNLELIKWHYKLFRLEFNQIISFVFMMQNILFGIYKKIRYVNRTKV